MPPKYPGMCINAPHSPGSAWGRALFARGYALMLTPEFMLTPPLMLTPPSMLTPPTLASHPTRGRMEDARLQGPPALANPPPPR
eukprot:17673-Chlamydomonas_euryale.AAC.2